MRYILTRLDALEAALPMRRGRRSIINASVFSMDGDLSRFAMCARLPARVGASLIVDEATPRMSERAGRDASKSSASEMASLRQCTQEGRRSVGGAGVAGFARCARDGEQGAFIHFSTARCRSGCH